jgi:hypothetical protein
MRAHPLLGALLACAALGLAACRGLPRDPVISCGADGSCPLGMICTSDQTCWAPPTTPPQALRAPEGLVAEVADTTVSLSWVPVKDAGKYEVTVSGPSPGVSLTSASEFVLAIPAERSFAFALAFSVRALATPTHPASARTAVNVTVGVRILPVDGLTAATTDDGVRVEWSRSDSTRWYYLERASDAAGPYVAIDCYSNACSYSIGATGRPGFDDRSGADDTAYWYRIHTVYRVDYNTTLEARSTPVPGRTPLPPPPAPVVRAKATGYDVLVSWDPPPGADSYKVAADCGTSGQAQFSTTSTSMAMGRLSAGTTCDYAVTPYRGKRAGPAGHASVTVVLRAPTGCDAGPAQGGAAISTGASPGPYTVNVFRRDDQAPAPVSVARGVPSGKLYVDQWPAPERVYQYAISLSNDAGESGVSPWSQEVRWLGDLDLSNAGPQQGFLIGLSPSWAAAQSFTADKDGLLTAIEVADLYGEQISVGVLSGGLRLATALAGGKGVTTFTNETSGAGLAVFDPPVPVSRGDKLWFEVWAPSYLGAVLGVTGDAYPNGELLGRATWDLSFKTFLRPKLPGPLLAPGAPVPTAGNGAISLEWRRSPGAVSYTVLRSTPSPAAATAIATVSEPKYVDHPADGWYSYSVMATDSLGATATSTSSPGSVWCKAVPVSVHGSLDPARSVPFDDTVGQVIKIDRTGQLSALEVSLGSSQPLVTVGMGGASYFTLRNAAGLIVGQGDLYTNILPGGAPPALDPEFIRASAGAVGLYSQQTISVTQGQVLTLSFRAVGGLIVGEGPSAEGGELSGGVGVPGRSLHYKLIYQ